MTKKLSEEDIKLIKKMGREKTRVPLKKIAEFFGVSKTTIDYHLHNRKVARREKMRRWRQTVKKDKEKYKRILEKDKRWRKKHKERYKVMVAKSLLKGVGITLCDGCISVINEFINKEKNKYGYNSKAQPKAERT